MFNVIDVDDEARLIFQILRGRILVKFLFRIFKTESRVVKAIPKWNRWFGWLLRY